MSTRAPADELPDAADDPAVQSRAWVRAVDAETAWTEADWLCRSEAYNDHLGQVDSAVTAFEREHGATIDRVSSNWTKIAEQAAELGFDGSYASLG